MHSKALYLNQKARGEGVDDCSISCIFDFFFILGEAEELGEETESCG